MKEFMKKLSLLLLCIPSASMVALLTSSLIYILAEYSQYSESLVTMIVTIPSLTVIAGLVVAPILIRKYSIKSMIILGMSIFIVCSILPVWCKNFYVLLFLRALSGAGCGIILPLQATLLATYPEKERATLMGLNATVGCLISAVIVAISGVIAEMNWRWVFFLYLVNVVALVMTIVFVPKSMGMQTAQTHEADENTTAVSNAKLSDFKGTLAIFYFLLAASYVFVTILNSEMAPYIENVGLGGSAESGVLVSVVLIGSMIAGLVLSQYMQIFKSYSMPVIFLGSTVAFLLLWIAPSLIVVGIAAFLLGLLSSLVANVVNYELSKLLPLNLFTLASSGLNFFIFVLQFMAPMAFLAILGLIPSGSFRTVFLIYAAIQAVLTVIALFMIKRLGK